MDLLVLGPLEVRRDGRPVEVRRGRPRRLLLSLLLRRGDPVPQDTLIDQLWGDAPPVNADNALHLLVSYLRRTVAGERLRIDRGPAGYRLVVDPGSVDAARFEELVRRAAAAQEPGVRLRAASEALALWRGPAFAEAADDAFAQADIARLDELRVQACESRADALLALGRHDEALPDLAQLAREHPFRERLQGQLALALYRAGRQAEALAALHRARTVLAEDLGLDPGPGLAELERQVLRQDRRLDPPLDPPLDTVPAARRAPVPDPAPDSGPAPRPPAPAEVPGVPVALTSLVGRDEQVAAVRRALGGSRVVTLTGPGGAGKSRLAAEVVRPPAGRGTVWWADLAAVPGGPGVGAAVAAATGTGLASDDAAQELRRWIGGREAVLVLDTCEHVADEATRLVAVLTAGCPGLRVLATSRRPLGVPGELVRPVPTLPVPAAGEDDVEVVGASPAVRLYCERAAAVRPGFVLDAANAGDVAAVCRLLDGLPLAIELAAGHAAALSPRKTAALLADRLRLLGDGALRAAIDGSYGLLTEDEAAFLDRLAVFAGPFPLEAAAEVAGAGLAADGLQLLLSLVRQSLVAVGDADHFRLLDTVRAFAGARLATRPDEASAAADRHACWYAAFAEDADRSIRGADQAGWLAELRASRADLRAALAHCLRGPGRRADPGARMVCALSWFWSHEGSFAEARAWIAEARAAGPHGPRLDAELHLAAGMHAESVGELAVTEEECTRAAAGFAAIGDSRGEARALLHLGTARWALGRLDDAATAQDRSIGLYRSVRDDSGAGLGLVLRARTALDGDDARLARELLVEARHLLRRAGDPHLGALCLDQLARTCLADGAVAEAERLAQESLAVFEAVGYREGVTASLQTLAQASLALGEPAAATALLRRAGANALELGQPAALAETLELLGEAVGDGDPRAAARLVGAAGRLREEGPLPRTPSQERRVAAWLPRLRAALGERYAAAVAEGRPESPADLLAALPDGAPRA
ncbi:AfsR/SARP family transcriptional regulator [Geodermatophilus nigrescens]|uniref:Predicted ATPase n=1 Tax=Geodermatophilus nigrescens TaxID=1070870 RepID=A0A1M5NB00_9ACTN|nr:BTAD domain-containing putative transcriptional regulator [Geodermatophilus nigrescens]SHG86163.1 Predicted ATPase [Geodermatophilus nigrescens]